MRKIMVPVMIGGEERIQEETVYKVEELPLTRMMLKAKVSHKKDKTWLEIPCAFDIETTNMYVRKEDGKIDPNFRPYAFMYHWQLCIGGYVIFGRRWDEFRRTLRIISNNMNLSDKNRLVIYVHNLAFETQFMKDFLNITDGFYKEKYKPLYIVTGDGFEFRDSLALSNMNLMKFCENEKNVIHYKLEDRYDYKKIRTPDTPLTMEEEAYCYNDVAGLVECIRSRMESDTLQSMPLTSTGYVRRDLRNNVRRNKKNRKQFTRTQLSPKLYKMCREAFRGGDTHANAAHANKELHNVASYDITSSYPTQILTYAGFPYSKWCKWRLKELRDLDPNMENHCFIFRFRFRNIKYIGNCGIPYIPYSKCKILKERRRDENGNSYRVKKPYCVCTNNCMYAENGRCNCDKKCKYKKDVLNDNGRILEADLIEMTLTEIDYHIIQREYTWETQYISDIYGAEKGMLPKEIRDICKLYYEQKTGLKNVDGSEYEYARYKALLNAIYGCMCQKLITEEISYDNHTHEYVTTEITLEDAITKYYKSRNNFLRYQDAIYITAAARMQLRRMLWKIGEDVVYCDTDSIKFLGDHDHDFEEENIRLREIAIKYEAYADSSDGKRYYLGEWDNETKKGRYPDFKTLGAKKYLLSRMEDGEKIFYSTIAGVSKKAGHKFFNEAGMEAFKNGTTIPESGHLVAFYNNNGIHKITVDGCTFETASNIALVDDTYTIGLTDDYTYVLQQALENIFHLEYN